MTEHVSPTPACRCAPSRQRNPAKAGTMLAPPVEGSVTINTHSRRNEFIDSKYLCQMNKSKFKFAPQMKS
jgi:hypothetical protein